MQKKNLSSRSTWKGTRSDPFASGMAKLQVGRKGRRTASHSGSGNYTHRCHRDGQSNDLQRSKGSATFDKTSEDLENLTQLHRESNSVGIQEKTFSSVLSSSAVAPSPTFTFDVCCEDGIQLYADLNSSPSDWIENLKAGVRICHDVHKPLSQSFHQDKGLLYSSMKKIGSLNMDASKDADNGQLEVGAYLSTVADDSHAQTDEPEELKSLSNDFDRLDKSKEEKAMFSSNLESGIQGKLPGIESSIREKTLAADSGLDEVLLTEMSCDFTGNYVPSDPKCSGFPVHQCAGTGNGIHEKLSSQKTNGSLDTVLECSESSTIVCTEEMQTSTYANVNHYLGYSPSGVYRCVDSNKQLKNEVLKSIQTSMMDEPERQHVHEVDQSKFVSSPLLNKCTLDLHDKKSKVDPQQDTTSFFSKTDKQIKEVQTHLAENPGFRRTQETGRGTDEELVKDAALHSFCNDGPSDLVVVPKKNGGDHGKSTESMEDNICKILSTADVRKLGTTGNGSDEFKCLNFKDQMKIPCKRPGSEFNVEFKKKSHLNGIEGQSKLVNTKAKILRSSTQFGRDVHSKRRRSSRLFTK